MLRPTRPSLASPPTQLDFYGTPLLEFDGASSVCFLCKKLCRDAQALEAHISEADHREKLAAAIADGRITLRHTFRVPSLQSLGCVFHDAVMKMIEWLARTVLFADLCVALYRDRWPASAPPPPSHVSETRSAPWNAEACGVVISECSTEPGKGYGAFATRPIPCSALVGVYMGEPLSHAAKHQRHEWHGCEADPRLHWCLPKVGTKAHARCAAKRDERAARLEALTAADGRPIGGAQNGGRYVWTLLPPNVRYGDSRVAHLDAEDPCRSSWCRYINNAPASAPQCNLRARVDAHAALVWFEARRDIAVGEELHFEYSGETRTRAALGGSWWRRRVWDAQYRVGPVDT